MKVLIWRFLYGGSYTVVFEYQIPKNGSSWKPTGNYYYHFNGGGANTLYENEGIGIGSDGHIYLSGISIKYDNNGLPINKGTRVEKTSLKAFNLKNMSHKQYLN